MRILVLVPTDAHRFTAGSRIRYDRLNQAGDDFDIVVQSLEAFTSADLEACDVCIFSKTYSVEAIAMAEALREKGKVVGIDLFDDLFSQITDARLHRFRIWLRTIAQSCQFALCSTQVMQDLLHRYAPSLPVHVVPDPFPEIDPSNLASTLATKLDKATRERRIEVVWFGNGSNPFFPVGLYDVAAFSWSLADLMSSRFEVHLKILTDEASQTAANLARLKKLPVPYRLDIWSVEAEQQALDQAMVSFIPVNGQSFSQAKSFNRALTAISAGNQVLSPGYPLYRGLHPAIYTEARELLSDLERLECRIGPNNVEEIAKLASKVSKVGTVAGDLFEFLSRQRPPKAKTRIWRNLKSAIRPKSSLSHRRALIYGFDQNGLMFRAGRIAGILSVGTPFSPPRSYDIQFVVRERGWTDVLVRPELVPLLAQSVRSRCSEPVTVGNSAMVKLDSAVGTLPRQNPILVANDRRAILQETSAYRQFLIDVESVCRRLFPTIDFFVGDMQYAAAANRRSVAIAQR